MFRFTKVLFLINLLLISSFSFATPVDNSNQPSYEYLNSQRSLAGMSNFEVAESLAKAAYNHAIYLADTKALSHYQTRKRHQLFTGEAPKDRAFYTGWQFARVLENFTFGETDAYKSIDGLFTSIYHRIGFLDFYADAVGAALAGEAYVFKMSNAQANALCSQASDGNIYGVCRDEKLLIDKEAYGASQDELAQANPEIILWPPEQAIDVVPVFYEEIPEPLPSHKVSGNPISIHFNPYYYPEDDGIKLNKFTLLESCKKPVNKLIHLNKHNDPNKLLSGRDFVVFPDARLKFNTQYCVTAEFSINNQKLVKDWSFTTVNPYDNLVVVPKKKKRMQLQVTKNEPVYIYFEPTSAKDTGNKVNFSYPKGVDVKTSFYDANTLIVELSSFLPTGEVNLFFGSRNLRLNF